MISESATILIVEDEQDIRELLAYNLEKEGYATVQAADGKEGLELARSRKPDLILLDLMLPKMDGLAVCRELERDSGTVRIPMTHGVDSLNVAAASAVAFYQLALLRG